VTILHQQYFTFLMESYVGNGFGNHLLLSLL